MQRNSINWKTLLPVLLIVSGLGAIALAAMADLLGVGRPGFGSKQFNLALVGFVVLLSGGFLASRFGQDHIEKWHIVSAVPMRPLAPTMLLIVGVWFGLVTGLAEVLVSVVLDLFTHPFRIFVPHAVWMTPLADICVFGIAGLILLLISYRYPRVLDLRVPVFIFALLGSLSLSIMLSRLHFYAAFVLAVGLAVQLARLMIMRRHGFLTFVKGTTSWAVGLVLLMATMVFGWIELREQNALAKVPRASSGSPNVLLIVLDTVRAQSLSLYGYNRATTPNLERLADKSVVFDHAISTAPWTLPSHASMFTGRYHHEVSAGWKMPLDETHVALAEVLTEHGYVTAGFVANLVYCAPVFGLARGFAYYKDYPISLGQIILSSSLGRTLASNDWLRNTVGYHEILNRKTAEDVNREFLVWLSHQTHRPFFVFLNYYDAHQPYLPPAPFDFMFGPRRSRARFEHGPFDAAPSKKWGLSAAEVQTELDAYEGAIAYIDHNLGLLFHELNKRGVLQNTIVIVTSDHGEEFGEHGVFGHGDTLYLPSLHVPLLISLPSRVPGGTRVTEVVSLKDLPATVMDLTGVNDKRRFSGASLARFWRHVEGNNGSGSTAAVSEVHPVPGLPKPWYPTANGDIKSLVFKQYQYILNGDGREELYDFQSDPWETLDLANSQEHRRLLEQARSQLESIFDRR